MTLLSLKTLALGFFVHELHDRHSLLTAKWSAAKALARMNDAPAARRKLSEDALLARQRGFGLLLDEAAAMESTIKR